MKNRAKCLKCKDVLESFHAYDYVECSCGEIGISGGTTSYEVFYKDLTNFARVNEKDEEVVVSEREKEEAKSPKGQSEKQRWIDEMIQMYENLPDEAKRQPVTHSDLEAVLLLMKRITD